MNDSAARSEYPDNPMVVRVWRAGRVESVHRGAWCLVDPGGEVLAGAGALEHPYFVRSSVKSLQALPLLESGAAERFQFSDGELALAIASHAGEPCHTETARRTLERLGLGVRHLRCGVHPPTDGRTREALRARSEAPSALHNNCSGKHVGFLALAKELGVAPAAYLAPDSAGQRLVRAAIAELSAVSESTLDPAIDGCSAPTYRLALRNLALAFARLTNPAGLPSARRAHAQRLTRVAAEHPELIGGNHRNLDTEISKATHGRLFAKIGAEAVHALGVVGGERGLALKIDDGGARALPALVLGLLEHLGLASAEELARLAPLREVRLQNFAGLEVGHVEVLSAG
ncbi:MAG: asparaginase [Planctomycetes bacterium]|nr:asparaginase [Planctomycetota bacterium]